jgi:hypothetical protein
MTPPNYIRTVVLNGTYFDWDWWQRLSSPWTTLTLGLKVNNAIVSLGSQLDGNNRARAFTFDGASAKIVTDPRNVYKDSGVHDAIGVYTPETPNNEGIYTGRTLVGLRDDDRDGNMDTVIFFSSSFAEKTAALSVLAGFGAVQMAQLDGGHSSALIVDGVEVVKPIALNLAYGWYEERAVPHAIAAYAGAKITSKTIYSAHVEGTGWLAPVADGDVAGTTGQGRRMEAIRLIAPGRNIFYRAHVQNIGWMAEVANGADAGTTGRGLRMEAIQIRLDSSAGHIYYRAHVEGTGWMDWVHDGAVAGTTGRGLRIEAVQIYIPN